MNLAYYKFHLTYHAYLQYQERVEQITFDHLQQQCTEQLKRHGYNTSKDFVQLAGVWWVFKVSKGRIRFVTCYGKSDIDMPLAKKWAKRHNDRIRLSIKPNV